MKKITLIQADITTLAVDAIVNSAKSSLTGGSGVDGAIHRAAGRELLMHCLTLEPCEPGQSVLTDAYALPCRKIIHAVGPRWSGGNASEREILASCYRTALDIASREGFRTVAFPCIGVGCFHFPHQLAASIAVSEVRAHPYEGEVIFCCYSDVDKNFYEILLGEDADDELPAR